MAADALWSDDEWRAAMSTAEINDLPDSDFAYIESGGEKDDDGKTTPRSLRHYPIHDEAHVRNALSRAAAAIEGDDDDAKRIAEAAMPKIKAAAKKLDIDVADEAKGRPRSVDWRRKRAAEMKGVERRIRVERVEIREADDGMLHLSGYASVTDTFYDMGWYDEQVARGAFRKTLAETPDVVLNINHGEAGSGLPIARTKAGNLTLAEDRSGLKVDATLDPEDPDVQLLNRKMAAGNLDGQMSFAFRPTRQSWNDDYTERTITEIDLHRGDVSVVTQGANPTTSSSIRTDDALVALRHMGAVGLVEAFFERREGAALAPETFEYLTQCLAAAAVDDAEMAELGRMVAERAAPTDADDKVRDALNAMAGWCTEAIAAQSADPDNNTDPDDAAIWQALESIHLQILAAVKLQAKDGADDEPDDGDQGGDEPPAARTLPPFDFRADRARLERLRHAPRREAA